MILQLGRIFFDIGGCVLFLRDIVLVSIRKPISGKLVLQQIEFVSVQSLATTGIAGFFVGAIMAVQFTLQVKEFGGLGYLGGLSTSATIREVGPLLIAFMLSGKIGAFTSSELGMMKVTEQMDAIRCLGVNPLQQIIVPRFIGIVISSFFLLCIGLVMSVFGGLTLGFFFSGINPQEYLRHIPTIVVLPSILTGMFKCFVFAFVLASVCTYKGYTASGGAKGIGKTVVNAAVATMVGIVLADWLTSYFIEILNSLLREA